MFILMYKVPGLNYQALDGMERRERLWYLKRLSEQLESEVKAAKRPTSGKVARYGV